jgi:hypothetical protein
MSLTAGRTLSFPRRREFFKIYVSPIYDNRGSHGGEDVDVGLMSSNAVWTCSKDQRFEDGGSKCLRSVSIFL